MPKIRISKLLAFSCSFVLCGIAFYLLAEIGQLVKPGFLAFYSVFVGVSIYFMWKILYGFSSWAFNPDA